MSAVKWDFEQGKQRVTPMQLSRQIQISMYCHVGVPWFFKEIRHLIRSNKSSWKIVHCDLRVLLMFFTTFIKTKSSIRNKNKTFLLYRPFYFKRFGMSVVQLSSCSDNIIVDEKGMHLEGLQ